MRWFLFALAAIPVLAQSGAIEGTVVDALMATPIPGAVVKVYRGDKVVQSVGSDAQGLFRITGLPDGEYRVAIDHSDHLSLAADHAAARTYLITAAAAEIRLRAELVPLAQIAGRVLNPDREPIKDVPVGLRRPWDEQWTQISTSGDDGRFQFRQLEPGTWILGAMPSFRISSADPAKNPKPIADPADEEGQKIGWVATFFPGVLDLAAAARIVLRPGAVLYGYDMKLRTMPLRRLSGVVVDPDGNPAPKASVSLMDVANKGANGALKTAGNDGRFEFAAGNEGEWRIFAQSAQSGRTLKGYTDLHVSRSDVDSIKVRLTAPFPVKGFVERDEPRDKDGKRKLTSVYLIPQEASRDIQESVFHEQDGSFVLKNVYPGRYRVLPAGFVPGYYVASTWYGDQEVTTGTIDIVDPPLPLKVVYRSGAGRVSGTVDRGEGKWVVLVPQDEALRDPFQFIRTAKCGTHGKFAIDNLRPGSYYAFAFDRVRKEMLEDVEFVRKIVQSAVRVDVRHGEAANLDLNPQVWPDY
jgi:hypothetical protein